MKFALIIGALIVTVLLCDRYKAVLPTPIRQLYALWEKFAHVFGLVMNTVILTVFWIVAIGLYAVILKIIGLFRHERKTTYWIPAEPRTIESLKHPF